MTMLPRQIQDELSEPGAVQLLESASAHLAYIAKDGTPRVIPVGYWWTGEDFIVSTATNSPKVKALAENPAVALTIDAGDSPDGARTLSVRGTCRVDIVDGVVEEYLMAARKSMGEDAAAAFERECRKMYPQMARIAIMPTWVRFYDYGAGRMLKFLQELAAKA